MTGFEFVLGLNFEDLELTGNADVPGTGNDFANMITGNAGANLLIGNLGDDTLVSSAGVDTLRGGIGDDVYRIGADADDLIEESAGQGRDTVVTTLNQYLLPVHLEDLTLEGSAGLEAYGNDAGNLITGNAGANVLEGRKGYDTLDGGAGADVLAGGEDGDLYRVDAQDTVVENADGGSSDTVEASFNYTLGAHVENLVLKGTGDISGTGNGSTNYLRGNSGANQLSGGAGHDVLDGGEGADRMAGGADNDSYIVDNAGDAVVENAGEGLDLVVTTVSYVLGAEVENLSAAGNGAALALTGNASDNTVTGNSAANVIDGGAGADLLRGWTGDDIYLVDSAFDVIEEVAAGGRDTVIAKASYALAVTTQVERLTAVSGSSKINLTGNTFGNALDGNAGANKLNGGLGNDVLTGGKGRDAFAFTTAFNARSNIDRIGDFNVADDVVQIARSAAPKLKTGVLSKAAFWTGAKAHDRDDRIIYDSKKGILFYDADGTGKTKAVAFANLSKKLAMTHVDFFVV